MHDFPREYRYFSVRQFEFDGRDRRFPRSSARVVRRRRRDQDRLYRRLGLQPRHLGGAQRPSPDRRHHGRRQRTGARRRRWRRLLDLGFGDVARPSAGAGAEPSAAGTGHAAARGAMRRPARLPRAAASFAVIRRARRRVAGRGAASAAPPSRPWQARRAEQHPSTLGAVASAAIQHLAPVAGPRRRRFSRAGRGLGNPDRHLPWRSCGRARRAQDRSPGDRQGQGERDPCARSGERDRVYRLRLLHFSPHGARNACEELRRQGIGCTVVPPRWSEGGQPLGATQLSGQCIPLAPSSSTICCFSRARPAAAWRFGARDQHLLRVRGAQQPPAVRGLDPHPVDVDDVGAARRSRSRDLVDDREFARLVAGKAQLGRVERPPAAGRASRRGSRSLRARMPSSRTAT